MDRALAPSFEFIFHFNREARKPNKTVPCKFADQETHLRADGSSTAMRSKDGEATLATYLGFDGNNVLRRYSSPDLAT